MLKVPRSAPSGLLNRYQDLVKDYVFMEQLRKFFGNEYKLSRKVGKKSLLC